MNGKASIRPTAKINATLTVVTYPEKLLSTAKMLFENRDYSITVVVCHMACEIATETAIAQAIAKRGIQDLEESLLKLLNGYNLNNNKVRDLYNSLTGDRIQDSKEWNDFRDSAKLRNKLVHSRKSATKEQAERGLRVAEWLVARLLD